MLFIHVLEEVQRKPALPCGYGQQFLVIVRDLQLPGDFLANLTAAAPKLASNRNHDFIHKAILSKVCFCTF